MDFTNLTKTIGDTIARIKTNNKLIEELNKTFNPSFVEIMDNLQKTDPTLAKMLMVWYMETYSVSNDQVVKILTKYNESAKRKTSSSSYSSGCGDSGGCGSPVRSSARC